MIHHCFNYCDCILSLVVLDFAISKSLWSCDTDILLACWIRAACKNLVLTMHTRRTPNLPIDCCHLSCHHALPCCHNVHVIEIMHTLRCFMLEWCSTSQVMVSQGKYQLQGRITLDKGDPTPAVYCGACWLSQYNSKRCLEQKTLCCCHIQSRWFPSIDCCVL